MMRSGVLNSHIYPVRTEMTGLKHIQILHVCSMDFNKSKEFLVDKNIAFLFHGEGKNKSIIID